MKILFLAHLLPLPLDSGGKIKSYYTLKALASKHEVRILAYVRNDEERKLIPDLKKICPNVEIVELNRNKLTQVSDIFLSILRKKSFIISRDFRSEMKLAFESIVERFRPDVVHIDHLQMAQFVDFNGPYKTVMDDHNVEAMIIKRIAETADSAAVKSYASMEWPKLQKFELDVCEKCDLMLTVSEEDEATLRKSVKKDANIHSVPIGVDIHYFDTIKRKAGSKNILSIGTMYWPPNVDSMLYFAKEIFPIVKEKIPDAVLTIAGQKPVQSICELAQDPSIRVTGYVDDSRRVAEDCGVFIVPLRSGSGVRVKILNAMAMGLPIVSTSIGAEGLNVEHCSHLLLADDPESFAYSVVEILNNQNLADSLGRNARDLVCKNYSWEVVGGKLLDLYDSELV